MFDAGRLRINEIYEIIYVDMTHEREPQAPMDEALGIKLHGQKVRLPRKEGLRPDPAKIRARYATDN
jgi:hypothetical protein